MEWKRQRLLEPEVVVEDVQRQQPMANIGLCFKTLWPMLFGIVYVPGSHPSSYDRH